MPVHVFGQDVFKESFNEFTRMLSVSAHGGSLALAARIEKGQRILIVNKMTRGACGVHEGRQMDRGNRVRRTGAKLLESPLPGTRLQASLRAPHFTLTLRVPSPPET
jgi:hypothetical protein